MKRGNSLQCSCGTAVSASPLCDISVSWNNFCASSRCCFTCSQTCQYGEPGRTVPLGCFAVKLGFTKSDQVLTTLYLLLCCPTCVFMCAKLSFRQHPVIKMKANCIGFICWKIQFQLKRGKKKLVIWVVFKEFSHLGERKRACTLWANRLVFLWRLKLIFRRESAPPEEEVFFTGLLKGSWEMSQSLLFSCVPHYSVVAVVTWHVTDLSLNWRF